MQINALTVGPIVGATTGTTVRLWGRGLFEFVSSGPRRCFGVARMRKKGAAQFGPPKFFKLNPNFDMTGVIVFDKLSPDTDYDYQMGYFFSDLDLKDFENAETNWFLDWGQIEISQFQTGSDDKSQARTFAFGSCRYLLRLFGGRIFDDRGDKTFRSISDQIDSGQPINLFLMVGDQIYADDLNIVSPDESLEEYLQRYRDVFSQPHIRALMSRVPTYMTLDDHEIEDDWPSSASEKDWLTKYPHAIHAYVTYQMSHSPLFALTDDNKLTGIPDKLWYTYSDGCCDFFMADTRTERYIDEDENERQIMSDEQLEALTAWLDDGSGRIKFITSSVPFFPDIRLRQGEGHKDKWSGFPHQRNMLLDFIRSQKIKRVVCLSGDVHSSMSAELVHSNDPDFKMISIVSSPFFQPFHFYHRIFKRSFVLDGMLTSTPGGAYNLAGASPVYTDNNFTRVTADLSKIKVEVFSRKGKLEHTKVHKF